MEEEAYEEAEEEEEGAPAAERMKRTRTRTRTRHGTVLGRAPKSFYSFTDLLDEAALPVPPLLLRLGQRHHLIAPRLRHVGKRLAAAGGRGVEGAGWCRGEWADGVEARAWRRLCGGGEISERTGADRPEAGSKMVSNPVFDTHTGAGRPGVRLEMVSNPVLKEI